MKTRKSKPIAPRIAIEIGEDADSVMDREFVASFSKEALFNSASDTERALISRGWKRVDDDWERDGLSIRSIEAFEADRIAAAAWNAQKDYEELWTLVLSARRQPAQIRALRIAYSAGMSALEIVAYRSFASPGRKKHVDLVFRAITTAHDAWRNKNTQTRKRPEAKELYALYSGPQVANPAHFANLVSRWRRLSSK